MDPLHSDMVTDLSRASRKGIADIFDSLDSNIASHDWLKAANPYRLDCIGQIKIDWGGPNPLNANGPALAEYISASVPLHCLDGWTFLARALSSAINGNPHQAAHFAYYAELRAAMSILAAQGIGAFSNIHFTIDQNGACERISGKRPTHEFVWLALDQWASLPSTGATLLKQFVVSNATFEEWFDVRLGHSVAGSLAQAWLRTWGIDLSTIDSDHDVRNLASYRPNDFLRLNTDSKRCSEFLRSMWNLLEPSNARFEKLDEQLLRSLIKRVILDTGDPLDPEREEKAKQRVTIMLNNLPVGDRERKRLRMLLMTSSPIPVLLERAQRVGGPTDPHTHEHVMARAALLLRVASGFTAELINDAPFNVEDLKFWTDLCGEQRAFWKPGDAVDDLRDLWTDVSDAISDETLWTEKQGFDVIPMYSWRYQREQVIRPLAECDRVGLWGLQR